MMGTHENLLFLKNSHGNPCSALVYPIFKRGVKILKKYKLIITISEYQYFF